MSGLEHASLSMVIHIAEALVLGWALGYERHFNGRSSGTQVYCLVCMSSCAVTLLAGYPSLWYWGTANTNSADPTRVIGYILTGIGFLGAGVIVQSGTTVQGLTTAASVWSSAAIGMLVGAGFTAVAAGLTALLLISLALISRIEKRLPARTRVEVIVRYQNGHRPDGEAMHRYLQERGLVLPSDALSYKYQTGCFALHFVVFAPSRSYADTISRVAEELSLMPYVQDFDIAKSSRA